MERAYYSDTITGFLKGATNSILGELNMSGTLELNDKQRTAWQREIEIMKEALRPYGGRGNVYFEWELPRRGGRIDVLAAIDNVKFVMEFKVGDRAFLSDGRKQVRNYAQRLRNFHEKSHNAIIAPILVATKADAREVEVASMPQDGKMFLPLEVNAEQIADAIGKVLKFVDDEESVVRDWDGGRYEPAPTIIQIAQKLYARHSVKAIRSSDADEEELEVTSQQIMQVIKMAKQNSQKAICFVTGVPGSGKTLVGLNVANPTEDDDEKRVFLSGNGPLVRVLREALARDDWERNRERDAFTLGDARNAVEAFIQNVHGFRDEYLKDTSAPTEHVAIFDEAQRAWNAPKTAKFMRKRDHEGFDQSEPEFLISCLDRHPDWAVIVCLVGGGQEIHEGEAGINEWLKAIAEKFTDWQVYISPQLKRDSEYGVGYIDAIPKVQHKQELHLSVSKRSFRAENVSLLVNQLLDLRKADAQHTLQDIGNKYPIMLTRNLQQAKQWVKKKVAEGLPEERCGLLVSSQAERLKPHAIDVRPDIDPVHWFLYGRDDVRSSYYLEDVATEFDVQGLEIDWGCLTWDADFRHAGDAWDNWSFKGNRWERILKSERRSYQKNAYRVLLTRARQGMVIVVPEGDPDDPTRKSEFYDPTYEYLESIGFDPL